MDEQPSEAWKLDVDGVVYECNVDPKLAPSIERQLAGKTKRDREVDALELPRSTWRRAVVRLLRWYRRKCSPRLGHRCVFDPSCSRYAEIVFRELNPLRATAMTIARLLRCRPGAGGADVPRQDR